MVFHYLTDEVGTILAVFDDSETGIELARQQSIQVATAFPDNLFYLHSGEFGNSFPPSVGHTSCMKGSIVRVFSGYSTSHYRADSHTSF